MANRAKCIYTRRAGNSGYHSDLTGICIQMTQMFAIAGYITILITLQIYIIKSLKETESIIKDSAPFAMPEDGTIVVFL
jgi:hypothetical protein